MKKLIPILLLLTACNAERRFNDYSVQHPDKFKQLAAVLAPCIEVNPKSDTIYQRHIDTLITPANTIIVTRGDTVFVTKQLPGKIITKTEIQTVTKTVADSRAVDACKLQTTAEHERVIQVTQQLTDKSKAKNTWMLIAIGLMVLVVGYVIVRVAGVFKI